MWVLRIELRSLARAASALNNEPSLQPPIYNIFIHFSYRCFSFSLLGCEGCWDGLNLEPCLAWNWDTPAPTSEAGIKSMHHHTQTKLYFILRKSLIQHSWSGIHYVGEGDLDPPTPLIFLSQALKLAYRHARTHWLMWYFRLNPELCVLSASLYQLSTISTFLD